MRMVKVRAKGEWKASERLNEILMKFLQYVVDLAMESGIGSCFQHLRRRLEPAETGWSRSVYGLWKLEIQLYVGLEIFTAVQGITQPRGSSLAFSALCVMSRR